LYPCVSRPISRSSNGVDYIITAYGPVLLLCVLRKRKTKDMSARLVIIIPSNLLSQYSIFGNKTQSILGKKSSKEHSNNSYELVISSVSTFRSIFEQVQR